MFNINYIILEMRVAHSSKDFITHSHLFSFPQKSHPQDLEGASGRQVHLFGWRKG